MKRTKFMGFSLIEVLVAMCIMAVSTLAMLSQQHISAKLFNKVLAQDEALSLFDNQYELNSSSAHDSK